MVNFLLIFSLFLAATAVLLVFFFAIDQLENWAESRGFTHLYVAIKLFWPFLFFALLAALVSQKVTLYG